MPRKENWDVRGRYARQDWKAIAPLPYTPLTAAEVCRKRLELAEEMLALVLEDGQDLAAPQRRTLQRLTTTLAEMRRQAGEPR